MQAPTEKQINLVKNMTRILGIDFPTCSKEYTKRIYYTWIKAHIDDYNDVVAATVYDEDYYYDMCENDVWCEYY